MSAQREKRPRKRNQVRRKPKYCLHQVNFARANPAAMSPSLPM